MRLRRTILAILIGVAGLFGTAPSGLAAILPGTASALAENPTLTTSDQAVFSPKPHIGAIGRNQPETPQASSSLAAQPQLVALLKWQYYASGYTVAPKRIVIGENMERVGPYAEKIGAEVYEGLPGFKPGMEAEGLADNMRVIQQKMAEGYEIIDIGPDFARRAVRGGPQPAYQMERTITKGYEGYSKAFTRTSKTTLVLPEP